MMLIVRLGTIGPRRQHHCSTVLGRRFVSRIIGVRLGPTACRVRNKHALLCRCAGNRMCAVASRHLAAWRTRHKGRADKRTFVSIGHNPIGLGRSIVRVRPFVIRATEACGILKYALINTRTSLVGARITCTPKSFSRVSSRALVVRRACLRWHGPRTILFPIRVVIALGGIFALGSTAATTQSSRTWVLPDTYFETLIRKRL